MALVETQQLRMLERLRHAGEQPVTLEQLRAGGIDLPAVVIGQLELNGYAIERVCEHGRMIGVRLLETEAPIHPPHAGAGDGDGADLRDSHRRNEMRAVRRWLTRARSRSVESRSLWARSRAAGRPLAGDRPRTPRTVAPAATLIW
jgi:hypothetical protein